MEGFEAETPVSVEPTLRYHPLRPHETRGIHGPNERVAIDNLELGVNTLVAILEELGG